MSFLKSSFLIVMAITVTLSFDDFRLDEKNEMVTNKVKDFGSSFQYLPPKSENGRSHTETKRRRTRRDVSEAVQNPGSTSFTPLFSGQCFLCPPGTPGPRGPAGQQGIPGRDGRDGRDATNDCGDVEIIDTSNVSGGAIYVRWGRNECPPHSELIYHGVVGGSHYTHEGSGTNFLCMPEVPIYDEPVAGTDGQNRGYVYGAEFETNTFANWNHLHNNNVYCVVCRAPNRPSLLMIPGRNICPESEWTIEYSGYLFSAYYGHSGRTEFVCMDRNAEAFPGTAHNADGALFYPVEGRCGASGSGLPCGPYVDGYELTCAVCTR